MAARRRGGLFDGMRVGKTLQGVWACDLINAKRILVVCPGLARNVWRNAFDDASLMGRPIQIADKDTKKIIDEGVVIIHMDGSRNDHLHKLLMAIDWCVLILDEAHFLKEVTSQRTGQVLSKNGFASKAKYIWFLTGTPVLNSPQDMWVMLRTVGATKLSADQFRDRYCTWRMGDFGPIITGVRRADELKELHAKYFLRRTWPEVRDQVNPGVENDPEWHELVFEPKVEDEEAQKFIEEYQLMEKQPKLKRAFSGWQTSTENGQADKLVASRSKFEALKEYAPIVGYCKVLPLVEWLTEKLENREIDKAVIFFHHKLVGEALRRQLSHFGAKIIYGGTKPERRDDRLHMFNTRFTRQVLVCQDNIGRQAIDLCVSNHLIFAEMDWVPENNAQAAMRIQGPRQSEIPHIYTTSISGSLDEVKTRVCLRKAKIALDILG